MMTVNVMLQMVVVNHLVLTMEENIFIGKESGGVLSGYLANVFVVGNYKKFG